MTVAGAMCFLRRQVALPEAVSASRPRPRLPCQVPLSAPPLCRRQGEGLGEVAVGFTRSGIGFAAEATPAVSGATDRSLPLP